LVFDCWTKPELLKRWMTGPSGWELVVCEIDLRGGETTATNTVRYATKAARDGVLRTGMEQGMPASYDRLAEGV
jgi:uncharacterized protein YndB with AHSA1/START domain